MQNILGCLLADKSKTSDSFQKRIYTLLDTQWDCDYYMATKLLRLAKLLKQQGEAIDAAALLSDLLYWNSDSRRVQRAWARAIRFTENTEQAENVDE
jgi:CRISPR type I-E-associated protein CasB/Cse2